jgi:hypothetical protein
MINLVICKKCLHEHLSQKLASDTLSMKGWFSLSPNNPYLINPCLTDYGSRFPTDRKETIKLQFNSNCTFEIWLQRWWEKSVYPCPYITFGSLVEYELDAWHRVSVSSMSQRQIDGDSIPVHCEYMLEQLVHQEC